MGPKRIGLIGFPGAASVDLSGSAEAFSLVAVDQNSDLPLPGYEIVTVAESRRPFAVDCGLMFKADATFRSAPPLDTIIVPGAAGLQKPKINDAITAFLRRRASEIRRIVSLCTGIYALAAAGLLTGRRVTTHWRYARDVAIRFPALRVEPDRLFIKDGKFYTSAGATAGIDLALSLIEEDYGPEISLTVARDLVVYLKRSGNQEQFSESLQFQTTSFSRLSDLATWIVSHLNHDLSVEKLAAKACLCPRQFGRRFKTEVGSTPAEFVEKARIDEARRRLYTTGATVEIVASSVGFKSSDVFRRRFEHRVGISPTEFRRRFNKIGGTTANRPESRARELAAA